MAIDVRLRRALRDLAERFIDDVIAAVTADAVQPPAGAAGEPSSDGRSPRKRIRRRAESLLELCDAIVACLQLREGVAVSDVARAIGSTPRALARPIALLLSERRIVKSGERRGTRYFLPRPPTRAKAKGAASKAARRKRAR